jgi:hypothetical protein
MSSSYEPMLRLEVVDDEGDLGEGGVAMPSVRGVGLADNVAAGAPVVIDAGFPSVYEDMRRVSLL